MPLDYSEHNCLKVQCWKFNGSLMKRTSLANSNKIQANTRLFFLSPERIRPNSLLKRTIWHQLLLRNKRDKLCFVLMQPGV